MALPAELPCHHHSHHRRARRSARHHGRAARLRLQHQHADTVRHGACHRSARGRRHRGRRKRGTRDSGRASRPRGSHGKIHGSDQLLADRHRRGALRRVPAHGLHERLHGRDLPAVLRDHRVRHDAVGARGPYSDALALRQHAQASLSGRPARHLRLVQPHVHQKPASLFRRSSRHRAARRQNHDHLRRPGMRSRLCVQAAAHLLPSLGRPGRHHDHAADAPQCHTGADKATIPEGFGLHSQ